MYMYVLIKPVIIPLNHVTVCHCSDLSVSPFSMRHSRGILSGSSASTDCLESSPRPYCPAKSSLVMENAAKTLSLLRGVYHKLKIALLPTNPLTVSSLGDAAQIP